MTSAHNDDPGSKSFPAEGDSNGQAAVLLVESLIHALVARAIITSADAVEVIEVAFDVIEEMSVDSGERSPATDRSIAILSAIHKSLKIDTDSSESN
ncbi:hypothetical protein [Croceicoccus marinus]|uniref:Uncharacterized protein n=1 Tax=Croceicoccus marinus TaxID=450378 RepID=A0A1Z1FCY4_9SPHN|nr:hypothetical protein [Croceicoccus marinus]ARU16615.1 hypothetical protein A9D14_11025 [Croceicoccus marinus]